MAKKETEKPTAKKQAAPPRDPEPAKQIETQKEPQPADNTPAVAHPAIDRAPDTTQPGVPKAAADLNLPPEARPELIQPPVSEQGPQREYDEPTPESLEERTPEGTPTGQGTKTDTLSTWPTI